MKNRPALSHFMALGALFLSLGLAQETGMPFHRYYAPKEYDNSTQVWGSFQAENGLMYFGMTGGGGIAEYDGKNWRVIPVPTTVFSFAQDTRKRIYTGAINDFGYLSPDERGKIEFISLRHLIPEKDLKFKAVWFTVSDGDDVYFMSVDAIFKYSQLPQERIKTFFAGPQGKFTALFRHAGELYAMQGGKGMLRIGDDSLEVAADFFKDKPARNGLSLSPDSLIVPTRKNGLYLYRFSDRTATPFTAEDTAFTNDNVVYASALLPGNAIALGSNSKGVLILSSHGTMLQRWSEAGHLPVNSIYQIYSTPDRTLWLSTENGILRTEMSTPWSYWNQRSGLNGAVMDILRFEGRLYVATLRGVYFINAENEPELVDGIPVGQSWRLFIYTTPERKKILLAGVWDGAYQITGDRAVPVRKGAHTTAFCVSTADPSRIFFNTNPSLVSMKYEKGKWKEEGIVEGVNDNLQETVQDANGELWISTYAQGVIRITPDGANVLKPKRMRYYTVKDGLPSMRVVSPYSLNGIVVFGTEKGLFAHNAATDRFEPYTGIDTLLSNGHQDVLEIKKTHDGKIVILPATNKAHRAGYLQPTVQGTYVWTDKPFLKLPQMEFESVFQDSNGVLWIGGTEGLFRYDPAADRKDYLAGFSALVRKVTVKGDSVVNFGEVSASNTFEYDLNDVRFEFAAPFYDDESKTVFSHQLVGYEEEWSHWSGDGSAVYTNLDEGEYTFRAKAKNLYGVESDVAQYTIRILPPWFRTWWAYLSYVLLLGSTIKTFDTWNKKRLKGIHDRQYEEEKRRQQQFSRMLIERQEVERQRIAREMHDGVGQELLVLKHHMQLKLRESVLNDEMKQMLEEQSAAASNIITEVRNISHDLRPPELDQLGLTETIKALLKRIRNTKKIEVIGEIDTIDGFFPAGQEINIVRIIQESMNNILKHAEATVVRIHLLFGKDGVILTIADNGKGMSDTSLRPSGLGMNDIKERVQLLGGTMEIVTAPGNGTAFTFRFSERRHDA